MSEPSFSDISARRIRTIMHLVAEAAVHNTRGEAEKARELLAAANRELSILRVAFDNALGPKHLPKSKRGR